eukprot:TRINITY_DN4286_c0_g1_i1.p1 TRINITY_DN4286_c0_g1~~TRINITY_DN4286_c0_g1_i1.p1  ORF type:complete len:832 (-),score=141.28 TRINITY_DN4286_c0_g1_i1:72-2567(-)
MDAKELALSLKESVKALIADATASHVPVGRTRPLPSAYLHFETVLESCLTHQIADHECNTTASLLGFLMASTTLRGCSSWSLQIASRISTVENIAGQAGKARAFLREGINTGALLPILQELFQSIEITSFWYREASLVRCEELRKGLLGSLVGINSLEFILPVDDASLDTGVPPQHTQFGRDSELIQEQDEVVVVRRSRVKKSSRKKSKRADSVQSNSHLVDDTSFTSTSSADRRPLADVVLPPRISTNRGASDDTPPSPEKKADLVSVPVSDGRHVSAAQQHDLPPADRLTSERLSNRRVDDNDEQLRASSAPFPSLHDIPPADESTRDPSQASELPNQHPVDDFDDQDDGIGLPGPNIDGSTRSSLLSSALLLSGPSVSVPADPPMVSGDYDNGSGGGVDDDDDDDDDYYDDVEEVYSYLSKTSNDADSNRRGKHPRSPAKPQQSSYSAGPVRPDWGRIAAQRFDVSASPRTEAKKAAAARTNTADDDYRHATKNHNSHRNTSTINAGASTHHTRDPVILANPNLLSSSPSSSSTLPTTYSSIPAPESTGMTSSYSASSSPPDANENHWRKMRPQMYFTVHTQPTTLDQQAHKCPSCGVSLSLGWFSGARYCDFTGLYFCSTCHQKTQSVIPARIVHAFDFTTFPVSNMALEVISAHRDDALFDLSVLNEPLYERHTTLMKVRETRLRLFYIKDFIFTCARKETRVLKARLATRKHFLLDTDIFSLGDFNDIHSGTLLPVLKKTLLEFSQHVIACVLCQAKGSVCEVCTDRHPRPRPIYPGIDATSSFAQCPGCKTFFHAECYHPYSCPKCKRLSQRHHQTALSKIGGT